MSEPVLLPYQRRWVADRSRVRVAEKSRRIGWSWAVAGESALEAAASDGCDTWYVGYNKDMAEEFIRDVSSWASAYQAAAADVEEGVLEDDDVLTFTVRFASGFRVTALSSRPTNLRNKKGRIVIDEAAHHPDLEGLLKAAMAVLMWGGRSRVDIGSTHNGEESEFNVLVNKVRARKLPYSLHRTTLDDALRDGLFKRICLVNGWAWSAQLERDWRRDLFAQYGDAAEEELLCVPARSGGTYLNPDLIERQMRPGHVARYAAPRGFLGWSDQARRDHVIDWCVENMSAALAAMPSTQLHFFGEDFGRVADRTVVVIGHLTTDLQRVFTASMELLDTPFEQQAQALHHVLDRVPRLSAGALDATGNGAYLAEVTATRYGLGRIHRVDLSESWYRENLPVFKAGLDDKTCWLVRDADHKLDLGALKTIRGSPRLPEAKTASTVGPLRHGDAAIAYAVGHFASRQELHAEIDYQATRARVSRSSPSVLSSTTRHSRNLLRRTAGKD